VSWRDRIPVRDWETYEAAGYGGRVELGQRPAVLVIDVTYGFVGRQNLSMLEAIKQHPNACGEAGWEAIPHIQLVLQAGRSRGAPVFYTAGTTDFAVEHIGRWRDKHRRTLERPPDTQVIVDEIAPEADDVVIQKTKPSVFFGTPLIGALIDRHIDTLVVTGCTTSGCVRASVIDAFSFGFRTAVVEDAVFDRAELTHAVNLFDMDQKYANVLPASQIAEYLKGEALSTTSV
jgi:maleamate amidohydrolase